MKHKKEEWSCGILGGMLFLLLWLVVPLRAVATDVDELMNYTVNYLPKNTIQITLGLYDTKSSDTWVDDGNLYVTIEGESEKKTVLHYKAEDDIDGDHLYNKASFTTGVPGTVQIIRDLDHGNEVVSTSEKCIWIYRPNKNQNYFRVKAEWTIPNEYRGKKLKFSFYVHRTGNTGRYAEEVKGIPSQEFTINDLPAEVNPEVMIPMLAYEMANAGKIMVPWMIATNDVQKVTYNYTDTYNKQHSNTITTATNGFVYLPFDQPLRSFYIETTYKDSEGNKVVTKSVPIDLPILHTAKNMTATLNADGTATVKWKVDYPKYKDILESDIWEVQRCFGNDIESNWQSIGQVTNDNSLEEYTYTDQSLFSAYQSEDVHYRVRRSSTAMWGWTEAAGMTKTTITSRFFLPYLSDARVTKSKDWGVNDNHHVDFTWNFSSVPLTPYDLEGRYIIRSKEDWHDFATLVNEKGEETLHAVMYNDVNLGTCQDMVGTPQHPYRGEFNGNGHTLTVNYQTDDFSDYSSDVDRPKLAPFAHVGSNVKIHDLRTAGSINADRKFGAGLIGWVMDKADGITIERCRSSVTINSTVSGDGTNGGFIAVVNNNGSNGTHQMTDCMFDGRLMGKSTSSWGGFVGFTRGTIQLTNCLFAPQAVDVKTESCYTFVRSNGDGTSSSSNLYATVMLGTKQGTLVTDPTTLLSQLGANWEADGDFVCPKMITKDFEAYTEYTADGRLVLRNAADWVKFADMVNGGQTSLNVIMANNIDLGKVQDMVGTNQKPYTGDFNGNGYTLTYALVNTDKDVHRCAPFAAVGEGCHIRNLHVKGSIDSQGQRAASLISDVTSGKVYVENCLSDVDIKGHYDLGGLIGFAHGETVIKNCAFYGSLTSIENSRASLGGIIGWGGNGEQQTLESVLFAPSQVNVPTLHERTHAFVTCNNGTPKTLSVCITNNTQLPLDDGAIYHDFTPEELTQVYLFLGTAWSIVNGRSVPTAAVANSEDATGRNIALWDERAKMVLHTEMVNAAGEIVHTDQRTLSDDEVKDGKLSMALNNTCVDYQFYLTIERNQSPLYIGMRSRQDSHNAAVIKTEMGKDSNYEFNLNGEITGVTATQQQSSVQLEWTTNGLGVDYFRVLRHDKADPNKKDSVLVTNYQQTQYTDESPQPQHVYVYRVEAIVDCEGQHLTYAETDGQCSPKGMVCGYVRLADGTALAGATVTAKPADESNIQGGTIGEAVTDDSGYFEISDLVYQTSGSYTLTVRTKGNEGTFPPRTVTFSDSKNLFNDVVFYMDTYYIYAGTVMYDGSSIPVLGAQFLLDGHTITKSTGPDKGKPVTTNSAGEFSLSLPQGNHTLQVVKEGHIFANKGFVINHNAVAGADSTQLNVQADRSAIFLWDKTRVTLRGRVVGGVDQGNKPLGKSLSRNNLGDSIRIVLQLEGDNVSWIVRDQMDESIKMRDSIYLHGVSDTTRMVSTRYVITISPDNKTGEYEVPFYPTKYKVTDIYCNGYATLFQSGKVGETLDLSDKVLGDTITYNRIYHKPATLLCEQFTGTQESYFGLKSYRALDNLGKEVDVPLWDKTKGYSLGHPVFMAGSPVLMTLSAREEYYYNNVTKDTPDDIVLLSGGTVYMHNGLIDTENTDSIQLNEEGKGSYLFTPQNLTFTNEGDNALRSLTLTLLYDNTYYDIKPVQGYVMASVAKPQGRSILVSGIPHLIDILRDPPGGESSAFIESGSKLRYGYHSDLKIEGGFNFSIGLGKGSDYYMGQFANGGLVGTTAGFINSSSNASIANIGLTATYSGGWNYSYEFETTEKIATASGIKSVGSVADLYIGTTDETAVEEAIAVRVVPESMYKLLVPATGNTFTMEGKTYEVNLGTVKVLAEGEDATGQKVYLIRDEVLQTTNRLKSTFVHSEGYIENELLQQLLRVRESLMLPMGTTPEEAVAQATRLRHPVYVSHVPADDDHYTLKDDNNKPTYTQYVPKESTQAWGDSIAALNQEMLAWIGFLATNEKEKLTVSETNKVNTYSFDGGGKIEYAESFSYATEKERYVKYPGMNGNFFGDDFFGKLSKDFFKKDGDYRKETDEDDKVTKVEFQAAGVYLTMSFKPVFSYDANDNNSMGEGHTKKTGFSLGCDRQSYLTVDVYRTPVDVSKYEEKIKNGEMDIIYKYSEETKDAILSGSKPFMSYDVKDYSNFVYRTRGGATKKPYEDARYTKHYNRGTLLDAKTLPIDNPRIWTDQATMSNVPYGEPARFTLHLTNESETPNLTSPIFLLSVNDESNQKGAKIFIDGMPLTANGINVLLEANKVIDKQVEVYANTEFDYEDIGLCILDADDPDRSSMQTISAHFLPSAGKVTITSPGDNWVLNTESPYNKEKELHYMPVRIEDFNVNARGFDHIELQYKLSTEGDKNWVNVCSYYKSDSLMALASGERKLIKNDGYIDDAIFYGEKDPIEQNYDLRAVVYCRHAGGYITASSPVLSGVKDTRIPVPFGTPKPVSGILDIGDDIIISFSEKIAGNYLSKVNNFAVLGSTNSTNIALSTALRFTGSSITYTQGGRSLGDKDFTFDMMLKPDRTNKNMVVLVHGSYDHHVTLGLTHDNKLFTIMEGQTAVSDKAIDFNGGLSQVCYTFKQKVDDNGQDNMEVTFYDGTTEIGRKTLECTYFGNDGVFLGANLMADSIDNALIGNYEGEMLELRLWGRALEDDEIGRYAQKVLTGYELDLVDNWALNEGRENFSYDKAVGGSDMILMGTSWTVPEGISMKLDGEKGIKLKSEYFNRKAYDDYTLMFWFRTEQANGTLMANGMAQDEANSGMHFNIGVENGKLVFRSAGQEVNSQTYVSDGAWHHFAVTVNRPRNVGNIYIDEKLKQTFATEKLGGINGEELAIGATYTDANTAILPLKGNIDEIGMFEMVLPENLIQTFNTSTPSGEEMGTMVYLPFSRAEKLSDNAQHLMPTGISLRRYRDNKGKFSETRRDTIVAQGVVNEFADRQLYARMREKAQLENLEFSYVVDDQDLLLNLDVPEASIEKTNVYITVKDVADLNGNLTASPVLLDLYVYRNPLRWEQKQVNVYASYGEGASVEVKLKNLSGKRQNYTLQGLPVWITASKMAGVVDALNEESITLTISPYINIGDFNEKIFMVCDNGMSEPLPLNITIRGEEPVWSVSDGLKNRNITMHMVGRVLINNNVAHDPDDILAVFGDSHLLLGTTHIDVDQTALANEALAYLTIYNVSDNPTPLRFEFYDATTGQIHVVEPDRVLYPEGILFKPNTLVGSSSEPIVLTDTYEDVQTFRLKKGWNWLSAYIQPNPQTINELLGDAGEWEVGDGFEVLNSQGEPYQYSYKSKIHPNDPNQRIYFWDHGNDSIAINPAQMYRVYSKSEKRIYMDGWNARYKTITVKHGWNRIGYVSPINLPIATALTDYTDYASEGDIIKSQNEFATLNIISNNKVWKGSLKYMRAGEGYMIKRNAADTKTFSYPTYGFSSRYSGNSMTDAPARGPLFESTTAENMNVIAVTEGIDLEEGDRLVAYHGAEVCGVAEADEDGLFFLTVAESNTRAMTDVQFTIERDGEVVALTEETMAYRTNAVIGSVPEPTVINFIPADRYADGEWYTLQGLRLNRRPTEKGAYIFNGKKVFIK